MERRCMQRLYMYFKKKKGGVGFGNWRYWLTHPGSPARRGWVTAVGLVGCRSCDRFFVDRWVILFRDISQTIVVGTGLEDGHPFEVFMGRR